MDLKSVTPTDMRQNLYQYVKDVNEHAPIEIKGRTKEQSAVLIGNEQYQNLLEQQVSISATNRDILYQKLSMLDKLTDDVFYRVAKQLIETSFKQISTSDMLWNSTNAYIGCISCYLLRAMDQPINRETLTNLSELTYQQLVDKAKTMYSKSNLSYYQTIEYCTSMIEHFGLTDTTKDAMMQVYRIEVL